MSISYVEIYEDRVRDLLCESSKGDPQGYNPNDLAVREDEEGKTFIENVELVQVTDQEQIYAKKEVRASKGIRVAGDVKLVLSVL